MSVDLLEYTHEIKGYELKEYFCEENTLIARISKNKSQHICADCKSINLTATKVGQRQIKALPMGTRKFRFEVTMHRLRCHDCQAYKMEELDLTSSTFSRTTKSLERTVIDLRKHMCIKAVASYFDLHWDTVKNIEKRHLKSKYEDIKLKNVKAIGIDEIFMGKSLGEKGYLTIVRDLHSGGVLFVGKGKKGSCLDAFAEKLKEQKVNIEIIAVDLAVSFTSWINKKLPKATIVYDHFHVIKLMNDRLGKIRRRTMNNLEDHEKKELKNRRWHYMLNRENLSSKASDELKLCNKIFEDLSTAYSLKESLRNIYSMSLSSDFAHVAFTRWCEMAKESQIPELLSMAKTITKYISGILAFWTTGGMSSASMEGFNNKVGWMTRQAYGYRDEEYLILKIYDLPNLKITHEL